MIDASIVICTYRRPQELDATLKALAQQTCGCALFEVVLVDNDPEGSASGVIEQFSQAFYHLEYVREPTLGIAFARTRGAKLAQGKWVVYLDDDCVPDPNWLEKLLGATKLQPTPGAVAGTILPMWQSERPRWLTSEFLNYLSLCNYHGPENGFWLDFPTQYPLAANSAYPRSLLMELGGFNPELGRKGDKILLWGEETELNYRILKAGYGLWYCPSAVVHHMIPPARLQKAFFRSRYYWDGRTWALLHLHWFGLQRVRRELFLRLTWGSMCSLGYPVYFGLIRRNPLYAECLVRRWLGYMVQAIQIMRKDDQRECHSPQVVGT